ncbi:beta-galactosidase [Histidinibacterium aquaticum]|uniref:Beta-galactosidase n=1 Tax=Histidinibacterium aquaticum TaxID=2613962 RepID=A0A5J5GCI2_9RHOB|nr:beta-galactosidase [Histidinibacterium aquaticum]KAA9005741.1 beta-galactosidase [Histidinibacterium aquaticum]
MKRALGTCYYPEHWPRELWAKDAQRMVKAGLTWVRIGEFAWKRVEPRPEMFDWEWLDEAIDVLGRAGLSVVLGTPTATPPRWMLDRHPDMLAVDAEGRQRGFGSRRHYCFSHDGYLDECRRIVTLFADRYGRSPHVAAWQTDNEYGCHDTVISYSSAASKAFRRWLRERYGTIESLNYAWGNVFWSMEYDSFDQIDLPILTVTEPNPAHSLAFRRFSSEQVARFNRAQVEIIRARSDAPISHNYMGRETAFDHFEVGRDLDIVTWDSYPLGFLEDRAGVTVATQRRYSRQGDPDFQAFHHDLYRSAGRGRWWVMEQQPGPVNWAPHNPAPLPGMVRLWTWEAFAHGAEAVCYFRWRQLPFAQEQLHSGLQRADLVDAPAMAEAEQVARELADAPDVAEAQAPVALIFDYDASWAWEIQPHGAELSYFDLVLDHYRALRRAGLSVDILPPTGDFDGYRMILAPGLMHMSDELKARLMACGAEVLIGPRAAARNEDFAILRPLPPAISGLDVLVSRVESLRPELTRSVSGGGSIWGYSEDLEGAAEVVLATTEGAPVAMRTGSVTYMGGWGDEELLDRLVSDLAERVGQGTRRLPEGVRVRETGTERFWFNHTDQPVNTEAGPIPPAGVLREPLG